MSESNAPLFKQRSWSQDMLRDEAWARRKGHHKLRRSQGRLCKSVTDDDLDELKASFELGFGFGSESPDPKLSDAFPAIEFYHYVNKQYSSYSLSRTTSSSSTVVSDSDASSCSIENPSSAIFDPGDDDPEMVKVRLRQWA